MSDFSFQNARVSKIHSIKYIDELWFNNTGERKTLTMIRYYFVWDNKLYSTTHQWSTINLWNCVPKSNLKLKFQISCFHRFSKIIITMTPPPSTNEISVFWHLFWHHNCTGSWPNVWRNSYLLFLHTAYSMPLCFLCIQNNINGF